MKKSEVKSQQPVSETLEAPISLTPEQLEAVAAGMAVGYYKPKPIVIGGGTVGIAWIMTNPSISFQSARPLSIHTGPVITPNSTCSHETASTLG